MTTGPRLGRRPREGAGGVDPAARAAVMSKVRRARARRARWRRIRHPRFRAEELDNWNATPSPLATLPSSPCADRSLPRVSRPSSRRRVRPSTNFTRRTRSPSSPPAEAIPPPPPRAIHPRVRVRRRPTNDRRDGARPAQGRGRGHVPRLGHRRARDFGSAPPPGPRRGSRAFRLALPNPVQVRAKMRRVARAACATRCPRSVPTPPPSSSTTCGASTPPRGNPPRAPLSPRRLSARRNSPPLAPRRRRCKRARLRVGRDQRRTRGDDGGARRRRGRGGVAPTVPHAAGDPNHARANRGDGTRRVGISARAVGSRLAAAKAAEERLRRDAKDAANRAAATEAALRAEMTSARATAEETLFAEKRRAAEALAEPDVSSRALGTRARRRRRGRERTPRKSQARFAPTSRSSANSAAAPRRRNRRLCFARARLRTARRRARRLPRRRRRARRTPSDARRRRSLARTQPRNDTRRRRRVRSC